MTSNNTIGLYEALVIVWQAININLVNSVACSNIDLLDGI